MKYDRYWAVTDPRHGKQPGTRQMIELPGLYSLSCNSLGPLRQGRFSDFFQNFGYRRLCRVKPA